jgi:hypothetical protein
LRLKLDSKGAVKIIPMMKRTVIDHTMKWQPVGAGRGLCVGLSVTGLFEGELGQISAAGDSRYIRQ